MSIGTSPSAQVPPTVPAATGKKGREPWYYGYCYRMTLILLTLSGVFMLNAFWEMRDSGMIKKKVVVPAAKTPAAKAS